MRVTQSAEGHCRNRQMSRDLLHFERKESEKCVFQRVLLQVYNKLGQASITMTSIAASTTRFVG